MARENDLPGTTGKLRGWNFHERTQDTLSPLVPLPRWASGCHAPGIHFLPGLHARLSVAEYGVINLITNTVLLLTVLSKFGFQHSVQRYYPEGGSANSSDTLRRYYSTLFTARPFWPWC